MHFMGLDQPCMALFFKINSWQGLLENKESDKHGHHAWFPFDALPDNIIPRHRKAIELIIQGIIYSEDSW